MACARLASASPSNLSCIYGNRFEDQRDWPVSHPNCGVRDSDFQ